MVHPRRKLFLWTVPTISLTEAPPHELTLARWRGGDHVRQWHPVRQAEESRLTLRHVRDSGLLLCSHPGHALIRLACRRHGNHRWMRFSIVWHTGGSGPLLLRSMVHRLYSTLQYSTVQRVCRLCVRGSGYIFEGATAVRCRKRKSLSLNAHALSEVNFVLRTKGRQTTKAATSTD